VRSASRRKALAQAESVQLGQHRGSGRLALNAKVFILPVSSRRTISEAPLCVGHYVLDLDGLDRMRGNLRDRCACRPRAVISVEVWQPRAENYGEVERVWPAFPCQACYGLDDGIATVGFQKPAKLPATEFVAQDHAALFREIFFGCHSYSPAC